MTCAASWRKSEQKLVMLPPLSDTHPHHPVSSNNPFLTLPMGSERINRVVYIETSRSQGEVRDTFQQCGKIHGIYPWQSHADRSNFRCFLEFCDMGSVKRARVLRIPDITVHIVSFSPQLAAHFSTIAPPPGPGVKPEREHERVSSTIQARQEKASIAPRPRVPRPPAIWPSPPISAGYTDNDLSCNAPIRKASESNKENNVQTAGRNATLPDRPSVSSAVYATTSMSPRHRNATRAEPISGSKGISSTALGKILANPAATNVGVGNLPGSGEGKHPMPVFPMSPSPSSYISLSFRGERINCDLESLEENPAGIIAILRATANHRIERDKWMIVAGQYRSKGMTRAAIAVISTMIEVLMSPPSSLSADELRPANLMLSSCYTDLARQTRAADSSDTSESAAHMRKAAEFLQNVYGTRIPVDQFKREEENGELECAARLASMDVSPSALTRNNHLANASNLPRPRSPDHARERSRTQSNQVAMLEREIQSLRDRQASNNASTSQLRATKRKLEDDLSEERRVRRRAERALDTAADDLTGARRGEKSALEQCRVELEARRRAEARVEELETELSAFRREGRASREERRREREQFGRMGVLLLKLAKGEVVDSRTWDLVVGGSSTERGYHSITGSEG